MISVWVVVLVAQDKLLLLEVGLLHIPKKINDMIREDIVIQWLFRLTFKLRLLCSWLFPYQDTSQLVKI